MIGAAIRRMRPVAGLLVTASLVAAGLTVATVVVPAASDSARAASTAGFDPGNIISDDTFFDSSTMSASDVQAFLVGKVPSCAAGATCLRNYAQATPNKSADSYCAAYPGSSSESAASIVSKVGKACGINPQVLLVMLQKEQGLVLSKSPSAYAYRSAMGYGCPDTAACATAYYGFFNQVYNAAHQLQVYTKNSTRFSYQPGRTNIIAYNPSASCGTKAVYIQNQATANLYIYTPYTPNSAALAAGYGSAPCGAYGNRNFYLYFTDWFGTTTTTSELRSPSFEGGSTSGWVYSNGFVNRVAVKSPTQAQAGDYFLSTNTSVGGRSVSQDVSRATQIGDQATYTVWLRSSSATVPLRGKVVLWGLGGTKEQAASTFSVGSKWTQVTVTLPVRTTAHSRLRVDTYMYTTGTSLWVDNASLDFGAAPVLENSLANGSFEGTFAKWVPGNGFMNRQIFNNPTQAKQGAWFAASNTAVAGRSFSQSVPVGAVTGDRYTASIWLRSSNATPFAGRLALWGLGGSKATNSVTSYSVGSKWTRVQVALDVTASVPTRLKVEVYMGTTNDAATLWLDDAVVAKNRLANGSFEGTTTGWTKSSKSTTTLTAQKANPSAPAAVGAFSGLTSTTTAGTSISQDVTLRPTKGDRYTAEIRVRSDRPVKGRLAVWGLGPVAAAASTSFTAGPAWSTVTLTFPVGRADFTSLRFELYQDTANSALSIDGAELR